MPDFNSLLRRFLGGGARARESLGNEPPASPTAAAENKAGTAPGSTARASPSRSTPEARVRVPKTVAAKHPEPWVAMGGAMQPEGAPGRALTVRIGFDFGSAYSKVAVRLQDQVFYVTWEGVLEEETPYFLPDQLSLVDTDVMLVGRVPGRRRLATNLKIPLLGADSVDETAEIKVVALFAWVFRYVRGWLWHRHPALVQGRRIAWDVNLGCPARSWSDKSLVRRFEDAASRGWLASQGVQPITFGRVQAIVRQPCPALDDIGLNNIAVIPEIIAEIAGYVFSPQRQDGLHLMVDVGAGTLDLACFNIFKAGDEYRYPLFGSAVHLLGTHILMTERLRSVDRQADSWDDTSEVPDAAVLASTLRQDARKIVATDHGFAKKVEARIREVMGDAHPHHKRAREWKSGLPTFLVGGGASCAVYRHAIEIAERESRHKLPLVPLTFLHSVASHPGMTADMQTRLAVAQGLSYDAASLGRIMGPDDFPPRGDGCPGAPPRPDRDDLYPK